MYYQTVLIVIAQLTQYLKKEAEPLKIFIDYRSRTPIYEQIKEEIILAISRGELKRDGQLPSLRNLSSELGLNINTVKRALSELEDQGIIYTVAGKGIFVSGTADTRSYAESALGEIRALIKNAKAKGATKQEILDIVENEYKEDEI